MTVVPKFSTLSHNLNVEMGIELHTMSEKISLTFTPETDSKCMFHNYSLHVSFLCITLQICIQCITINKHNQHAKNLLTKASGTMKES